MWHVWRLKQSQEPCEETVVGGRSMRKKARPPTHPPLPVPPMGGARGFCFWVTELKFTEIMLLLLDTRAAPGRGLCPTRPWRGWVFCALHSPLAHPALRSIRTARQNNGHGHGRRASRLWPCAACQKKEKKNAIKEALRRCLKEEETASKLAV